MSKLSETRIRDEGNRVMGGPLTDDQVEALRWIARNDSHESSWLRNGKLAWGDYDKWDAIRCTGPRGSIVIPVADWERIRDYVEPGIGTDRPRSIHVLTEAGRQALSQASSSLGS